jgi:ZIP family zinc transporter
MSESEIYPILLLALLPAMGNLAGALVAEFRPISARTLSLALHLAAGMLIAIVGVKLVPLALTVDPAWAIVLALFAGGAFFMMIGRGMDRIQARYGRQDSSSAWVIFLGVSVDLFADGLMIGTGAMVDLSLGLLLALGQVCGDLPEGFASIATFKDHGISRRIRLALALAFFVPVLTGAGLGYLIVRNQPELLKMLLLAFTAGILLTVTVEELVPEAHKDVEPRLSALAFVGGFSLFTLISVYFQFPG